MSQFKIDVIIDPSQAKAGSAVVEKELVRIGNAADQVRTLIGRAFKFLGVAAGVEQIGELVDAYTQLQNRLRVVVDGQAALELSTQRLVAIANGSRTGLEKTVELYSRVALATRDLGKSQNELLGITESINKAIILSGAGAKEAENGLIQLSQGIASNRLGGDELRSVLEQLPVVADVIAKHMGITRGELRKLGVTGAITGKVILDSFTEARDEIANKFSKTIPTVGQGFQVLRNNLIEVIGEFDKSVGTSRAFSAALVFLSQNLETLLRLLIITGSVLGAVKLAPYIQNLLAAAEAYRELSTAISTGNAVELGSIEARRQEAVFIAEKAAAQVAATEATLAAATAESELALVTVESTVAGQAAAVSKVREAAARLSAARATGFQVKAEEEFALVAANSTKLGLAQAEADVRAAAARVRSVQITEAAVIAENELAAASTEASALGVLLATQQEELFGIRVLLTAETESLTAAQLALDEAVAANTNSLALEQSVALSASLALQTETTEALTVAQVELDAAVVAGNESAALQAAQLTQVAAIEVTLTAETEALALANEELAAAEIAAAESSTVLGRALVGARAGLDAFTASIAANPVGALLIAVTLILGPLILFRNEIKLSGDSLATFGDVITEFGAQIGTVFSSLGGYIESVATSIADSFPSLFGKVEVSVAGMLRFIGRAIDVAFAIFAAFNNTLITVVTGIGPALGDLGTQAVNALIGVFELAADFITAFVVTQQKTIERFTTGIVIAFTQTGAAIKSALEGDFDSAAAAAKKAGEAIYEGTVGAVTEAPTTFLNELTKATQTELIPTINNAFTGEAKLFGTSIADSFVAGLTDTSASDFVEKLIGGAEARAKARKAAEDAAKAAADVKGHENIKTPTTKFDELIREAREREEVLSLINVTNQAREVETTLIKEQQKLRREGQELTDAQVDQLRTQLTVNQSLSDQVDVMTNLRSRTETQQRQQDAANAAFDRGAISASEYAKALRVIDQNAETGFQKQAKDLELQNQVLSVITLNNAERQLAIELQSRINELNNDGSGDQVTDAERSRLAALIASNQALQRQNELIEAAQTPQEALATTIEDATAAFDRGAISATQYDKIINDATRDAADLGLTLQDGVTSGVLKAMDTLKDIASVTENVFVNAFQSAEDALVSFAQTGQFNFKQFATSIIGDILRVVSRLLILQGIQAIAGVSGGGESGGFANFHARADGGDVAANRPYLVGEEGPELFVPNNSGNIIPHDQTAKGMVEAAGAQTAPAIINVPTPRVDVTVVNSIDSGDIVSRGLDTPKGERSFVNTVGKNKNTVNKRLQ